MRFLTLLILIFPAFAIAGPPSIVITDSGYFALTVGADGEPLTERITSVVDMRGNPQSTPTQPLPTPTAPERPKETKSPDEPLTIRARAWAESEMDPAGAGKIAMIYRQVSEAVARGEVSPDSAANVTRAAAEATVTGWSTFRSRVGSDAAERIAAGGPLDKQKMADFLLAVSIGVQLAAEPISLPDAVKMTEAINKAIGGE